MDVNTFVILSSIRDIFIASGTVVVPERAVDFIVFLCFASRHIWKYIDERMHVETVKLLCFRFTKQFTRNLDFFFSPK